MSRPAPVRAIGSTLGQSTGENERGYQWRGQAGWDPARVGRDEATAPRTNQHSIDRAARIAEFTALREGEGLTVGEAGKRMGIAKSTAKEYESVRAGR